MNPLNQAISDVETAQTNLANADAAQGQAQAKYDAALAAKNAADQADAEVIAAFNASLDALIAPATSAKVVRTGTAPGPVPVPTAGGRWRGFRAGRPAW